jgi:hypothetical protein
MVCEQAKRCCEVSTWKVEFFYIIFDGGKGQKSEETRGERY